MECKSTTFFQSDKIIFASKSHSSEFQHFIALKIFFHITFISAFFQ